MMKKGHWTRWSFPDLQDDPVLQTPACVWEKGRCQNFINHQTLINISLTVRCVNVWFVLQGEVGRCLCAPSVSPLCCNITCHLEKHKLNSEENFNNSSANTAQHWRLSSALCGCWGRRRTERHFLLRSMLGKAMFGKVWNTLNQFSPVWTHSSSDYLLTWKQNSDFVTVTAVTDNVKQ